MADPAAARNAPDGTDLKYRKRSVVELYWRDWGGDSVAFEVRSGTFFHFDPLAAAVMGCFEERPTSTAAVISELSLILPTIPRNDLKSAISGLVQNFHLLGWLEPAPDS